VLCEKPLAPDAATARRMAQACASAGVALVEAYMTPFHPRSARWDELVDGGVLGRPRFGIARFTFPHADPTDYRWRPEAGGGALLDLGIYCLEPLLAVAGWRSGDPPPQIVAHATMSDSAVDATFAGFLSFATGFAASFCCSFDAPEAQTLEVIGSAAALRIEPAFTPAWDDRTIAATGRDGTVTTIRSDPGAMYTSMVDHVSAVVRGREAQRRPPSASIALAEITDRLRAAADGP
jgi:predicted dehydrogenase